MSYQSMPYQPMPCDLHDHLELACIAKAELKLELRDGEVVIATPITTHSEADKTEWLECSLSDSSRRRIRLDWIKAFEPTKQKCLFQRIEL